MVVQGSGLWWFMGFWVVCHHDYEIDFADVPETGNRKCIPPQIERVILEAGSQLGFGHDGSNLTQATLDKHAR